MGKMIIFTRKRILPFLLAAAMVLSTAVIAPPAAEVLAAEDAGYKTLGAANGNPVKGTDGGVPAYTFDLVTGEKVRISFLNDEIVRINMEPDGNFLDNPVPNDPEHTVAILEKPVKEYTGVTPTDNSDNAAFVYETNSMRLTIQKADFTMKMERKDGGGVRRPYGRKPDPCVIMTLRQYRHLRPMKTNFSMAEEAKTVISPIKESGSKL